MSNSISLNSPSYLDICKSELDPAYVTLYSKESDSYANHALIYTVAFPIIVVVSLAIAALVAPIFILVTGFSALQLIPLASKEHSDLVLKAELAKERSQQFKSVQAHYESLANATPAQIQQMLSERDINFVIGMRQNDAQLTTLKPILARHLFWEERIGKLKKDQEQTLEHANKLSSQNAQQNRVAIDDLRREALNIENQLVNAKVKCAFVNAALFHPTCKGSLENIGTFSKLSGQERATAVAVGASKANDFFLFNKPNRSAITFEDAKRNTIRQLAMRLYSNIQH